MDFLLFVRTDKVTRYWDRIQKNWTMHPATIDHGYKTPASARAALTRLDKKGPIPVPTGKILREWGWIRRDKI